MYLLLPDGEHQEGHGGDCRRPGRGAGGAAGQRGPERLAGLAALWLDAMRKDTRPVAPLETARPLGDYRLVILGTPVWAGRSSAVMRSFLKDRGGEIRNAAYVLTRSSGSQYQEVYRQMDLCVPAGHLAAVSLRSGDVGWAFWQEEFLRQVRAFLEGQ